MPSRKVTDEQRRHGGRFFRHLLRKVKPQHVPKMIDMLGKFGKGGKEIRVPQAGRWWMPMPHGYILIGQGPVGLRSNPTSILMPKEALRATVSALP
jgi:hypothetical protein